MAGIARMIYELHRIFIATIRVDYGETMKIYDRGSMLL